MLDGACVTWMLAVESARSQRKDLPVATWLWIVIIVVVALVVVGYFGRGRLSR
jgi:Na+/proline symporter